MKRSELISVAMGVRYRRRELDLLQRAIASILGQSHANLELLICENDSVQEARELLEWYAARDSRIRLINGTGTSLLSEKLNRCIGAANGAWIARQDDDDASDPLRLERQLAFLQEHPKYAFVGCNVRIEQEGGILGVRQLPPAPVVKDFLFVQPFVHPTLLFRRDCLDAVSSYSQAKSRYGCGDYDLLLRLYQAGYQGANLQDPCFTYHIPPPHVSNRPFSMRCNEVVTRWQRFKALGLLPRALPYVVKPAVVGLIPTGPLSRLKAAYRATAFHKENRHE